MRSFLKVAQEQYFEPGLTGKETFMLLYTLGPMPPYGRRTQIGSSGQVTVWAGTFWGVLSVSLCAFGTQLRLGLTCFVIRHPSSVVRHPPSVIHRQSSVIHRLSSFIHRQSSTVCHSSSIIRHSSSAVLYPPSVIGRLSSVIRHPYFVVLFCIFSSLFPYFFPFFPLFFWKIKNIFLKDQKFNNKFLLARAIHRENNVVTMFKKRNCYR